MNMDKVFKVDKIAVETINKLCELYDVDPEKNPSILKINNGEWIRHVIFWKNRSYYEKEISEIEYKALKEAGFPCGL